MLVAAFLLLYVLVLCVPSSFFLDVGAGLEPPAVGIFDRLVGREYTERVGRPLEMACLDRFHAEEEGAGFSFRWSEPQAGIRVGGLAHGAVLLRLRMHGVPVQPGTTTRLMVGGRMLAEIPVTYPLHDYAFVVDPAMWSGDVLAVELDSTPHLPGGEDTRHLGVAVDRVALVEWNWARSLSPWPTPLYLAGTVLFLYLGLRRAGLGEGVAAAWAAALGVAFLVALMLPARPFAAAYAPGLSLATALAYPVLVITLRAMGGLLGQSATPPDRCTWRWLGVLFLVAFLLRFAGALSPRYASHDAPFHVNRLQFVERGALFFEHVSIEAEMRSDPYPGTLYLAAAPLAALVPDRLAVLTFLVAWAAASEVFLVWFLARQVLHAGASRWAALLHAAFPISLAAFWAGIYTNLFASWVVLLVAVVLVLLWQRRIGSSLLLWVPLLALLFLAHFGLLILWLPVLLLWGGLLHLRGAGRQRVCLLRMLVAGSVSLVLVAVLYYSYFAGFFGSTAAAVGSALPGAAGPAEGEASRWVRTLAELRVWWRWGVLADYAGIGLPLGGLGLLGLGFRRRNAVAALLWSMVAVGGLFWAVSMAAFYFTRYMLFLLPAVAVGAGGLLWQWRQRGLAGRLAAATCLALVCLLTVVMWLGLCLFGLRPVHVL